MEENKELSQEEFQEIVEKLPKEMQSAIFWALNHWNIVEWLCKNSEMTPEEIEELKHEAKEKKDYLLLFLVCAAQVFQDDH